MIQYIRHIIAHSFNIAALLTAAFSILLYGCAKEDIPKREEKGTVTLAVGLLRATADPNTIDNDNRIQSIAAFIFNAESQTAEWSHFEPNITALSPTNPIYLWDKEAKIFSGDKTVYVLVNYNKITTSVPITANIKRSQLEGLVISSSGGLSPDALLMSGKTTKNVSLLDERLDIPVEVRRMAARVEVFPYKTGNLAAKTVTLQKATLVNGTKSSVLLTSPLPSMPASPLFANIEQVLATPSPLVAKTPPVDYNTLSSASAAVRLYTYGNVVKSPYTEENLTNAPRLQLDVLINGEPRRYDAYLTETLPSSQYSLLPGEIYRAVAILDETGVTLTYNVVQWDNRTITLPDIYR